MNVLFFLSLVISICCALLATLWQQWARRYLYLTQHAKPRPEDRARIRAFFKNGVDTMHISLAVEGLPTLLHLSLFLFFGGLVVFLFNVNKEVSAYVVVCIGVFLMVYVSITMLPLIRRDSPYNTPLSRPFWYLWIRISSVTFVVYLLIVRYFTSSTWMFHILLANYRDWMSDMLGGVEDAAWREALEPSSKIELQILDRTINTLVDDDSLEKFFEAIPGFLNSHRDIDLEPDFSSKLLETIWSAMDGFMGRTSALPSNPDTEKIKSRRVTICEDIMDIIPLPYYMTVDHLRSYYENLPGTVERMRIMTRWARNTSHDVSFAARLTFAKTFVENQNPDNSWIALANEMYGLPDPDQVDLGRDNVILAILIRVCRQAKHDDELELVEVLAISVARSGIPHTLPVWHSFCPLWNYLVEKAEPDDIHVKILFTIRHLYNDLHQGDDAPPTPIPSPANPDDPILLQPSSYPLCHIPRHHPDPSAHLTVTVSTPPAHLPPAPLHDPTSGGGTSLHEANTITGPHSPSNSTADVSPPVGTQAATSQTLPPSGSIPSAPTA